MFRFVHTADIHLDSPLHSLAIRNKEAAELIANATRQSFVNTVDLCIHEKVDALLIAGDLYDGTLRSMKTAAFFANQMYRLVNEAIRVFIIRGNHDAESRVTRELQLPKGIHVFPAKGKETTVTLDEHGVAIHGVSFKEPHVPESLLPHYPPPKEGFRNIGLLHTSLAGSKEHDVYAPCSEQDLCNQGYDYWALGHIHKRMVIKKDRCTIVMPGIPQGRHINEAGTKSVTLGSISPAGLVSLEERSTSAAQFERVSVDLTHAESWSDFVNRAEAALRQLADKATSSHIIARVELSGISQIAAVLRRDADRVLEELYEAGRRIGPVFIEQCENRCAVHVLETKAAGNNPLVDLRHLMAGHGLDRISIEERVQTLLAELQKKLPPELRNAFENTDGALTKQYLSEGSEDILAQLVSVKEVV